MGMGHLPEFSFGTINDQFKTSLNILKTYQWLLDLYVLDFFVEDHWKKLPSLWRDCFSTIDPQTLGSILNGEPVKAVVPLSFLCVIKAVQYLSITRKNNGHKGDRKESCAGHPNLKNLFLKHVKLKKRHEITHMAEVVIDEAARASCNAVLDFGSGLGHLVRMLAYKNELYTAGIECQTQLTEEARKLDLELEYTACKHLSAESMSKMHRPTHINVTLSNHHQLQTIELPKALATYGLVGLHPCGDLASMLLRHFTTNEKVKFICLVGCCYMKLTDYGYPMSKYARTLSSDLSYQSREIACHAIEVYCDRLKKGDYEDLKIHAYRAALERILVSIDQKLKHAPVRSIKHSSSLTFERYCDLAFERLGIPLPAQPELWSQAHEDIGQWRRVVIIYTLRLMLAPLVETVILLDRILYVLEHGFSCDIQPVFNPKISPRNHIMIARRN